MAISFLSNINLNQLQLIKARVENQPGDVAAGNGVEGQIYFDTSTGVKVLKVWNGTAWTEVGGGVLSISTNNSTFINLANVGSAANPSLTASLNATGTPDNTKYLRGDNTWATIPSGFTGFSLAGNTGTTQTISSGDTVSILGGTAMATVAGATDTITINHSNVTRTDTTSTASPAFGGTFTAVDSVTSSAQGHITALNLKTVTLPTPTNQTITLSGEVTGSGTTSITTTVANNVLDVANFNDTAIITSSEGIANNNTNDALPTSAAVKAYVDASVAGGLIYQGGYNAATNTPNLDSPPTIAGIKKGWTYTVTADGTFFTEQVRIGDVLIAENDAPTTLTEWTTVQNNIDLASLTQVGIGNVNAGDGIDVSYAFGTATVSALRTSYATTISATSTITHSLGTRDVIIQLYDTVTYETIYSDNVRTTIDTATITFAVAPTNPVRVLVQK